MFAGTGARDYNIDFNNSENTDLNCTIENMLVGMIADACRVRCGDRIIFYLQQNIPTIREGKFYGIFKASHNWSFLDNCDDAQYLREPLGKSLTFRTLIEPDTVYSEGVTEWEALDEIRNMTSPNQMLWSLIYRKLKGNRGNTMITIYESDRLCQLIRNKNQRVAMENKPKNSLTFDIGTQQIAISSSQQNIYRGRQEIIDILPRLKSKYNSQRSFEAHLQAYIVKKIGLGENSSLDTSLLQNNAKIEWIGNEVSCGVGMQRIDIMLSLVLDNHREVVPIELKAVEASPENIKQIKRYVDWIEQYYIPNRQSDIQPMLVANKFADKRSRRYDELIAAISEFNAQYAQRCCNLKYIEYDLIQDDLEFRRIV